MPVHMPIHSQYIGMFPDAKAMTMAISTDLLFTCTQVHAVRACMQCVCAFVRAFVRACVLHAHVRTCVCGCMVECCACMHVRACVRAAVTMSNQPAR